MKKITGKVVSLVLALALVVTSFSATFAFADTTTNTQGSVAANYTDPTVTGVAGSGVVDLAVGGTKGDAKLPTTVSKDTGVVFTDAKGYTYTNTEVITLSASDWSASNSYATKASDGTLAAKSVGTTVFTASKTVAVYKGGLVDPANKANVTAKWTYTVNAVKASPVAAAGVAAEALGTDTTVYAVRDNNTNGKAAIPAISVNGATDVVAVYSVTYDNTASDAVAYTAVTGAALATGVAVKTVAIVSENTKVLVAKAATGKFVTPDSNAISGSAKISATITLGDTTTTKPYAVAVVNKVFDAAADTDVVTTFGTTTAKVVVSSGNNAGNGEKTYVVTGYNFKGVGKLTVKGGTIGDVSNGGGVDVQAGSVGAITANGNVTVSGGSVSSVALTGAAAAKTLTVSGGVVGTVTGTVDASSNATGLVTLTKGTIKSITTQGPVTVNGGSVSGNISGTTVIVAATAEKVPATVTGSISATVANIGLTTQAAATTVSGKINASGLLTIAEDNDDSFVTTLGGIVGSAKNSDGDYTSSVAFNGYTGTFSSLTNFAAITVDSTSDITDSSKLSIAALNLSGKFTAPEIYVGSIVGSSTGTVKVPVGKLTVETSTTGTPVLAATGSTAIGTLLFKSVSGQAEAFSTPGLTLVEKDLGNSVFGYYVDSTSLVGLSMSDSTKDLANGYSATLTASINPSVEKLPAGASIKWSVPSSDSYVTVVGNGTTATIKAINYDEINLGSVNNVTVRAAIVDANGDELYEYTPATCDVTVIAKPTTSYKSDTNKDVAVSTKYTFKITSLNGKAPTFAAGNPKVFTSALTNTIGSDYYYTITAVGKVGESAGIYVNGEARLVVATIKANYKSDTTSNITVKGSYTYKITAVATPTFGVGTPSAFTAVFVSKTGNDYLYKITAVGKTGAAAGIYVNGSKVNVATVG